MAQKIWQLWLGKAQHPFVAQCMAKLKANLPAGSTLEVLTTDIYNVGKTFPTASPRQISDYTRTQLLIANPTDAYFDCDAYCTAGAIWPTLPADGKAYGVASALYGHKETFKSDGIIFGNSSTVFAKMMADFNASVTAKTPDWTCFFPIQKYPLLFGTLPTNSGYTHLQLNGITLTTGKNVKEVHRANCCITWDKKTNTQQIKMP